VPAPSPFDQSKKGQRLERKRDNGGGCRARGKREKEKERKIFFLFLLSFEFGLFFSLPFLHTCRFFSASLSPLSLFCSTPAFFLFYKPSK